LLSKFVPGLGETVGMLSEVGGPVVDGINNVYEDYTEARSNKKNYGLMSAMKKLTQDYRGIHTRVKLKESYESEEE
jgi:hypothetical protein